MTEVEEYSPALWHMTYGLYRHDNLTRRQAKAKALRLLADVWDEGAMAGQRNMLRTSDNDFETNPYVR